MDNDDQWGDVSDEDLLKVDISPAIGTQQVDCVRNLTASGDNTTRTNDHTRDKLPGNGLDLNQVLTGTDDPEPRLNTEHCSVSSEQDTMPLVTFRHGQLWVTDLVSQSWCEEKMILQFTQPVLYEEDPVMTAGTNIHLARELAVQDSVTVSVTSREDSFGVKVLNIITSIISFLSGHNVAREIPIFGTPFECGIFVSGIIDELRCDLNTFDIELVELKTRSTKSLPSKPQRETNRLQVSLYRKLWNDLVSGLTTKDVIKKHVALGFEKEFGADLSAHISASGLHCRNLDEILDELLTKAGTMVRISRSSIEYCHQTDASTIAFVDVEYDERWLETRLMHAARYWLGEREAVGVAIEEAWKCGRCEFSGVCEWRRRRAEECARSNSLRK